MKALRGFWSRWRWAIVGGAWLAVFALGVVGYRADPSSRTLLDSVYLSVKLFAFSYSGSGETDWRLEVARFAAPAISATAFFQGIAALFRDQLGLAALRRARGHIVVCGLGDKGFRLASAYRERGDRVAAVEKDPAAPHMGAARAKGVTVITGDALDEAVLRQARVGTAARVIAVCGDDGTNAEIAAEVQSLPRRARFPLTCTVHIVDPLLCALLHFRAVRGSGSAFRLEFFNIYLSGARMWLADHSPFDGPASPHVMVVGLSPLGRELAVSAVQRWAEQGDGRPLSMTLVDRGASGHREALELHHPSLPRHAAIEAVDLDFTLAGEEAADRFAALLSSGTVTAVWVCFEDDTAALTTGLKVRQLLRGHPADVVVWTRSVEGVSEMLAADAGVFALRTFCLIDRTCAPAAVAGGINEVLARALHQDYLAHVEATSTSWAGPWDDLPEEARESNREAAAHLAASLHAIGCDLVPLDRWDEGSLALTDSEVEQLARREHDRWREERLRAGWRFGESRDDEKKLNPLLVEWDDMPAQRRAASRAQAALLPHTLARAGFGIARQG